MQIATNNVPDYTVTHTRFSRSAFRNLDVEERTSGVTVAFAVSEASARPLHGDVCVELYMSSHTNVPTSESLKTPVLPFSLSFQACANLAPPTVRGSVRQ